MKEILIYALPKGETERWKEDLLSTQCKTPADVEALKKRAAADGWHSFRVTTWDGSPPDFTKVIR
jgi:hypothetical protein